MIIEKIDKKGLVFFIVAVLVIFALVIVFCLWLEKVIF
jgi:hypothetical protein